MSTDSVGIDSQRDNWVDAVNSKSVEGYLAVLSDDVVWFSAGDRVITGKAEFRAWLEPFFKDFDYRFEVIRPSVSGAAEWAVERGDFRSVLTRRGETATHRGSYLLFWKRNGRDWLIERYLDSSRIPPGPSHDG